MEFIKVTTNDGLTFNGLLSTPSIKTDTIIIHIHGMSGDIYNEPWYQKMHEEYPKNNIAFLAGENRGTHSVTQFLNRDGNIVNIGNAFEKFEECILDIESWINKAKELGYKKIWLQGHSLGTSKIAYYLYKQKPADVCGVILLSPSDMYGCNWGTEKELTIVKEAMELISQGKGDLLLTHDLLEGYLLSAKTVVNFFGKNNNTAIFNFANPDFGFSVVNLINVPVLAFSGTKDLGLVGDKFLAMETLKKELINCPKVKTIVYEGAEHSFEGFEDNIISDVLDFILK